MKKRKKINKSDLSMDIFTTVILVIFSLLCIYPVWYVIAASFSSTSELMLNPGFMLWPKDFVVGAYEMVFKNSLIMSGFKNSLLVLGIGLPINLTLTLLSFYMAAVRLVQP